MKFVLLWAMLAAVSAQDETTYFEVGKSLSLVPDISAVIKPITSIRWQHFDNLVVDWVVSDIPRAFGPFRSRTELNTTTLQLDIKLLTLGDSGRFSLETDSGPVKTFNVKVIEFPPRPTIVNKPLVCKLDRQCALKCDADTSNLGPVTYQWKINDGELKRKWEEGDQLKNISSSPTHQTFWCKVITSLSDSEATEPWRYASVPPEPTTGGQIFGIIFGVIILAALAGLAGFAVFVWRCPDHRVSKNVCRLWMAVCDLWRAVFPVNQPEPPAGFVAVAPEERPPVVPEKDKSTENEGHLSTATGHEGLQGDNGQSQP